jgi:mRNA-degrading endonuclease RelE of RelBE toxin-antitoxin system
MERGLFDKTNNYFIKALITSELNLFNNKFSPYFYFYFSKFFLQNNLFSNNAYLDEDKNNLFSNLERQFNYKYLIFNIMLKAFKPLYFIFNIYFNRIDKKIKKFSRGKSSKYRIIYKYVAPYKRLNLLGF